MKISTVNPSSHEFRFPQFFFGILHRIGSYRLPTHKNFFDDTFLNWNWNFRCLFFTVTTVTERVNFELKELLWMCLGRLSWISSRNPTIHEKLLWCGAFIQRSVVRLPSAVFIRVFNILGNIKRTSSPHQLGVEKQSTQRKRISWKLQREPSAFNQGKWECRGGIPIPDSHPIYLNVSVCVCVFLWIYCYEKSITDVFKCTEFNKFNDV